ncbi:hypothetical protein P9E76_14480 [Schinkia azotoformans]|uniref:Uncharacterized protein n=1 Tax=Schinkia azotoformans LMG 9581 TaxID=1131731 RepID=K6DKL1_SCHAZ|nr:hypothetical protein [Schinkia azotoformans]EKN68844.1 hypothetical protein BAZO_02691 [Schinkia azotoformans LMG 9581]MEC1638318.1 hypothetical protein [Schinkia azotoformans]MEC1946248.1 hypothetical protein [Schinkia azotoformans]
MFFTVGRQGTTYKSNDYGIGYYNGSWKGFASGDLTGWLAEAPNYTISAGQNIYMHIAIVGDYVRLRVLDGNNFSKVFWDKSYYHYSYFPSNGSGVHFNRQITLCDTDEVTGTGLYFKNASFSDSYLYSPTGYARYSSNNTNPDRRGRFKADWTNYSNVTVHSSSAWYAEKISIEF